MHPQQTAYSAASAAKPGRWCWTCWNTGYRATVYRGCDVAEREPCRCHLGTLAHVRDGLRNLDGPERKRVPVPVLNPQVERIRVGMLAFGIIAPREERAIL